jgi:uncharacterized protein YndB with AHSA1/START domain
MELKPGGAIALTWHNSGLSGHREVPPARYAQQEGATTHGHVTRCEPTRLLSYTWDEDGGSDSEVTFELTPLDELVQLVLTHRRLSGQVAKISVAGGWHTHLGILAARLEGGMPPPFWTAYERLEAEYAQRLAAA